MSDDNSAVPTLDEQTQALITSLVNARVESALQQQAAAAGSGGTAQADEPGQTSTPLGEYREAAPEGGKDPGPGDGEDTDSDDASRPNLAQPGEEVEEEDEALFAEGYVDDDGNGQQPQEFSEQWYELHRGREIGRRFNIPIRFAGQLPVGFQPESVEHYRFFGAGAARKGRESEESSLFVTAAYLGEIANSISKDVKYIERIEANIRGNQTSAVNDLHGARWVLSDTQLATFGV